MSEQMVVCVQSLHYPNRVMDAILYGPILAFLGGLLLGDAAEAKFSFEMSSGLLYGSSKEVVYWDASNALISELDWELDQVWVGKLGIQYDVSDSVNVKFSFQSPLGHGQSQMVDFDWLVRDSVVPTSVSVHPAPVHHADEWVIEGQGRLGCYRTVHLWALLGYQEQRYGWMGTGGTLYYPGTITVLDANDMGIRYEQVVRIPYIGLQSSVDLSRLEMGDLRLQIRAVGSIWVHAKDIDYHYHRDLVFEENMKATGDIGFYAFNIGLYYRLTPKWELSLQEDIVHVKPLRGDTTVSHAHGGFLGNYRNTAGIAHRHRITKLGLAYSF